MSFLLFSFSVGKSPTTSEYVTETLQCPHTVHSHPMALKSHTSFSHCDSTWSTDYFTHTLTKEQTQMSL